jgi:hypothetical protein
MSLNAIARPAALEPGPFVTFVRCRTVEKVDSIVIWSSQDDHGCDLGGFLEGSVLDEAA